MAATNTTVAAGGIGAENITLSASTVDTVTFTSGIAKVEVVNLDGAAAIYFTTDGSTPTVGGSNCYVIPATVASRTVKMQATATATAGQNPSLSKVVKLISSGTPIYSVQTAD